MKFSITKNKKKRIKDNKNKGLEAEKLACDYLQAAGLQLLEPNFFSRCGEIDLIMQENDTLVFVEVRYRKNRNFGGAAASVTSAKQQRIIKTALYYQQQNRLQNTMRFDVIAIEGDNLAQIKWIKNAFFGG